MLVDEVHKVMLCFVPKSGCTTLLNLLAEAAPSDVFKKHRASPMTVHNPGYLASLGLKTAKDYTGGFYIVVTVLNVGSWLLLWNA